MKLRCLVALVACVLWPLAALAQGVTITPTTGYIGLGTAKLFGGGLATGSYTDAGNYEYGSLTSTAGAFTIKAETAGTGTDNVDIYLTPAGSGAIRSTKALDVGAIFSNAHVGMINGGVVYWDTRGSLSTTADATWVLKNSAGTGSNTLNLGPPTANTANGTLSISQVTTAINMATATGTGTGTITSANTAIPVGLILGVSCRVTPILAGAGLTTFSLGDGTDVDRYGAGIAKAADTLVNIANHTITGPLYNAATKSLVLTAAAGVFSTGILTCTTHYIALTPIGS